MTIALTGASGFLGRALLRKLLKQGYNIRALLRQDSLSQDAIFAKYISQGQLDIITGSLTDEASLYNLCQDMDVLIHCAGMVKALNPDDLYQTNGTATGRLFDIAQECGVKRGLYISSLAAREAEISHYAASKCDGEERIATTIDKNRMGWDVIRPPAIYGPGDRQVLLFFKMIARKMALIANHKQASISMIHVQDVVDAIYAWLRSKQATQNIYEICGAGDDGYIWEDITHIAADILKVKPWIIYPPVWMITFICWASQKIGQLRGEASILSMDKLGEIRHGDWQVHDHRFEDQFGWSPKINLDQGFAQTIIWYRQMGWL